MIDNNQIRGSINGKWKVESGKWKVELFSLTRLWKVIEKIKLQKIKTSFSFYRKDKAAKN